MDLYISQDELVRALAGVQGVVERRSTHQILGHALLSAQGEHLQITATDTEITVVNRHVGRVGAEGSISVNAGHLFQVARALPAAPVHLSTEENHRLVVDAPPAHFRLMGSPAEEFPPVPAFEATADLRIKTGLFRRMIDETLFAIPTDDNRYGLNGGHLEQVEPAEAEDGSPGDNRLRLVTTDGSRLCYSEAPFEGEFAMGKHMLIPRKALAECRKLLDDPEQDVVVAFGDRAATFTVGSSLLHTRLVDGEFPAYRSVLPKSWIRRVQLERAAFHEALRRVALEAQDRASTVRMHFEGDQVEISARSVDHGEAKHPVPIEMEGDPLTVGFNVRFFQDVVGCIEEDHLVLELGEALSPCVVRPGDREDALFIVMPIRLE